MKTRIIQILIFAFAITVVHEPLFAQSDDGAWEALYDEAEAHYDAGRYEDGMPVAEAALALAEKNSGPESASVASSLNILGMLYYGQREYPQAALTLGQALPIYEKIYGPDSSHAARIQYNLATVLTQQRDKYAEAEASYLRAFEIYVKANGPDHPDVASALNGLGELYVKQRKYGKAEPLFIAALNIWEKSLGPNHPKVQGVLHSLADLRYKADRRKRRQSDEMGAPQIPSTNY